MGGCAEDEVLVVRGLRNVETRAPGDWSVSRGFDRHTLRWVRHPQRMEGVYVSVRGLVC